MRISEYFINRDTKGARSCIHEGVGNAMWRVGVKATPSAKCFDLFCEI